MDLLFLFVHVHNLSLITMQHIVTHSVFVFEHPAAFSLLNRVLKRK